MDAFTIRPAEHQDVHALANLMLEYIVGFYKRPQPPIEKLHGLIHTLMDRQQGIQFVAVHDEMLVGFATLYFTLSTIRVEKVTVMNDLYIVESMRGTGVAKSLFEACQAYSKDNRFACMSWVTANDNKRAQRFYEKMGGNIDEWIHYSVY